MDVLMSMNWLEVASWFVVGMIGFFIYSKVKNKGKC